MACGEFGLGRMAEAVDILSAIKDQFNGAGQGSLANRHVIVTSGPTQEPIDPVRYIANRSSGTQGSAIATALMDLGAKVTFVTGPATAARPQGATVIEVQTAAQMRQAVFDALPADAAIMAAAVADWYVPNATTSKLKKDASGQAPQLEFAQNPDILAELARTTSHRPALVIGFAAETDQVESNATSKLTNKGCDWILANDVSPQTGIMGGHENAVTFISADQTEVWPRQSKTSVGQQLAAKIAAYFAQK